MASKTPSIKAEKRTISGKKVKNLRKDGLLPANIYGSKIKSQAVQVSTKDFESLYSNAGETTLIELTVADEKKPRQVLIHSAQVHPVTEALLHVDFHEVALTEKMKVQVPLLMKGESPAAEKNTGVLIQMVNDLEVEALPADLPDEIEIDISGLDEVGDEIKVSDIKTGKKFSITADDDTLIVRINPLEKEEEPEPTEDEEADEDSAEDGDKPADEETKDGDAPDKSEEKKDDAASDDKPKE